MTDDFGACVVLIPYPDDLPYSEVKGGHHVSLAYFGDTPLPKPLFDELVLLVAGLSQDYEPGSYVGAYGIEYFGPEKDAVVLSLEDDPDSLPVRVRDDLLDLMSPELRNIFGEAQQFPEYRPHLTLGYISEGFDDSELIVPAGISIGQIGVWNGEERLSMNLSHVFSEEEVLAHEGVLRRSGRYPWGSGENPHQHNKKLLNYIDDLRKKGMKDPEIAEGMGLTTTQLRAVRSIAVTEQRAAKQSQAVRLKEAGNSNIAIGKIMDINESQVRNLLNPTLQARTSDLERLANVLKEEVKQHGTIDVGVGTELYLGVSQTKLNTALAALQEEGYRIDTVKTMQLGTGKETKIKVLSDGSKTYKEIVNNKDAIKIPTVHTEDGGDTYVGLRKPTIVDPKRVEVRYGSEGGSDKDGVIELRRGVDDLSLGGSRYAQVRIAVGKDHYLKGMAVYADDLPDGVDIRFNTNKENSGNKLKAMKEQDHSDPTNPFGSAIKPGGQKGALNIVNEEGDWHRWSRNLSSQMLSKQTPQLAKQQLDLGYDIKKAEFDEINSLTNPTLKRKLLKDFAEGADASAIHMKAAALPRLRNHVILPVTDIKETEIYAPNYRNGEKVVLIRHPHGGIFEIPELTVNNRNPSAKSILADARDAVGIHPKVAERLSGADFDGDTVLVIPNNKTGPLSVKTSPALESLKNFDPKTSYPRYEGMPLMTPKQKQTLMGDASNLITDMTIKDANQAEIARAVKYSMVVIDAEKHKLNHKQARADMGIAELKKKYQGGAKNGAATVVSRASSPVNPKIPERKPRSAQNGGPIDKESGRLMWEPTGASYVNKAGETVYKTTKLSKMEATDDAHTLSSGTVMETIYANHANRLKAMANDARKEMVNTKSIERTPGAAKAYDPQVKTLTAKLNLALKNAPLERRAQNIANAAVSAKRQANPQMDKDEIKKLKNRELDTARRRTGARKSRIEILDDEWEAIQSGAVSNNLLSKILDNTDIDAVKQRAMPRTQLQVPPAKLARAKSMLSMGYTQAEIADALGVPASTLNDALLA